MALRGLKWCPEGSQQFHWCQRFVPRFQRVITFQVKNKVLISRDSKFGKTGEIIWISQSKERSFQTTVLFYFILYSYFRLCSFVGIVLPFFLPFHSFHFPTLHSPLFLQNIVLRLQSQLQHSAPRVCRDIVGINNGRMSSIYLVIEVHVTVLLGAFLYLGVEMYIVVLFPITLVSIIPFVYEITGV